MISERRRGGKVIHQRRGAADCGEYRQAAGVAEEGVNFRRAYMPCCCLSGALYAFPSFANSRNSHTASQIGLETPSTCVALSPRGVLTFTIPSSTGGREVPLELSKGLMPRRAARYPAHVLTFRKLGSSGKQRNQADLRTASGSLNPTIAWHALGFSWRRPSW